MSHAAAITPRRINKKSNFGGETFDFIEKYWPAQTLEDISYFDID